MYTIHERISKDYTLPQNAQMPVASIKAVLHFDEN